LRIYLHLYREQPGGTPSDEAVCDKAQEIAPSSAFPNTIDAHTPIPSNFVGLSNGTVITLGAGHYLIDTEIDQAQEAGPVVSAAFSPLKKDLNNNIN
jgi:hypothetical protein